MEQFLYDSITQDPTLGPLLAYSGGRYHVYPYQVPPVVVEFDKALTFAVTEDEGFPNVKSATVTFNIFAHMDADTKEIADRLREIFHQNHNYSAAEVDVVYSEKRQEFSLGFNPDDGGGLWQRVATYYFNLF